MILKGRLKTQKKLYKEKFESIIKKLNSLGIKNSQIKENFSLLSTTLF